MEPPKWRKRMSNIVIFIFFLCGGIEYAIILPSLWPFLDIYFHSEHWFYGVCFAAFSVSGLIVSPIFGYWTDRIQLAKPIILFCNLFEIGGNLLYFSATSEYMVLGGRFLSGIGTGAGASIFAMLARSTSAKERTGVFATAMSCRFIGLIVGPGLNALTARISPTQIGPFTVDKYNSPGLVMTGVWIVVEILVLIFFLDLPALTDAEVNGIVDPPAAINADVSSAEERDALLSAEKSSGGVASTRTYGTKSVPSSKPDSSPAKATWKEKVLDLVQEEWVVLLAAQFILFFNQTALETVIVPLGRDVMHWDILDTSLFYCGCAVEGIFCFVLIRLLSKRISDRWLLLGGIMSEMISLSLLLYYIVTSDRKNEREAYIFIVVSTAIGISALSSFSVSVTSLLSKFTSTKHQGVSQGVRRSVSFIATIMGPLWAGAFLNRLTFMLVVEEGLVGLLLIMVIISFSRLRVPSQCPPDKAIA